MEDQQDQLDKDLAGLCYLLRCVWVERGWRNSVIELRDLATRATQQHTLQKPATILYSDYEHLRENGLKPFQAINTLLDQPQTKEKPR